MKPDPSKQHILFVGLIGLVLFGSWVILWRLTPDSAESATIPDLSFNHLPLLLRDEPAPICLPSPPLQSSNPANEARISNGLNQMRSAHGLSPLTLDNSITQSARRHSLDMGQHNLTSHTGSDGTNAGDRLQQACYEWVYWGEIIGWGFGGNSDAMLNWWFNSPPHRDVILASRYSQLGSGYIVTSGSFWGHYWTVDFAMPASSSQQQSTPLYECHYSATGAEGGSSVTIFSAEPCPAEYSTK
jgi:uncharacterized protein YkwD